MEEIQVGNFIRDKEGNITEIISMINLDKGVYLYLGKDGYQYSDNCIIKHSENIIDLIEIGDYINGHKIVNEIYGEDDNNLYFEIEGGFNKAQYISENDEIKTILTHEQYNDNCFKI